MRNNKFDERQLRIRGDVFKHAFILLLTLVMANTFLFDFNMVWADITWSYILVICVSISVCSIELIIRDAYIHENDSPIAPIIIGASGLILLVMLIINIINGESLLIDNRLSKNGVFLLMDIGYLAVGVSFLIKRVLSSRAVD